MDLEEDKQQFLICGLDSSFSWVSLTQATQPRSACHLPEVVKTHGHIAATHAHDCWVALAAGRQTARSST